MKWAYVVVGGLLGAGIAVAVVLATGSADSAKTPTFDPGNGEQGASRLAAEAVERQYEYKPEVVCPEHVVAEAGATFTCEALVPNHSLIPVEFEVIGHLGRFVKVTDVWESEAAQVEYQWCKAHGDLKGRVACASAYEHRS